MYKLPGFFYTVPANPVGTDHTAKVNNLLQNRYKTGNLIKMSFV